MIVHKQSTALLRTFATCGAMPFTCTQGLGQHSKAVADLQAAADIKPGDDEVSVVLVLLPR